MTKNLSVAEAKARLSEVLSRVERRGERYVISRHGKPVAAVVPLEELPAEERLAEDDWLAPLLRLGEEGLLLADELDAVRRSRATRKPRPVRPEGR